MMNRPHLYIFSLLLVASAFSSCENSNFYEKNISVEKYEWEHSQTLPFTLEITDTTAVYDILLNIRHNAHYRFTNLYVNLHTVYPSGKKGTLLKRIEIGDNEQMSWIGECMNNICTRQEVVVDDIKFNEVGEYRFTIEHVMRTDPLPGVMSVGLRVEKDDILL